MRAIINVPGMKMKKKPKSHKKTTGTYICYKIRYYMI